MPQAVPAQPGPSAELQQGNAGVLPAAGASQHHHLWDRSPGSLWTLREQVTCTCSRSPGGAVAADDSKISPG